MATIGGLSTGTSNSVGSYGTSIKGFGGLASGLDTDSLIEGMTLGTRNKIDELLKDQTKNQWKTEGYRSVSDKLVAFSNKYLDIASSSSPYRASFFDRNLIKVNGTNNSKYVSVTGSSSALDSMSILGVQQMAKPAGGITNFNGSKQELQTGTINIGEDSVSSKLDGKSITIQYSTKKYTINLKQGATIPGTSDLADFTTPEATAETLNKLFAGTDIEQGSKLGDKVEVSYDATTKKMTMVAKDPAESSTLKISGGNSDALKMLGFMGSDGKMVNDGDITNAGLEGVKEVTANSITTTETFAKLMAGKEITLSLNGEKKTIKMPSEAEIQKNWSDPADKSTRIQNMADYFNQELSKAYGKDANGNAKVSVKAVTDPTDPDKVSLSFSTSDNTSVIRITDASTGLLGEKGILNTTTSASNRLNLSAPISASGLAGFDPSNTNLFNSDGTLKLSINGVSIKGLKADSSARDVIKAINDSDAGIKVDYLETADRFTISSTLSGAAGKVEFDDPNDLSSVLFGSKNNTTGATSGFSLEDGQDAIIKVSYGNNSVVTVTRDSNTFTLDGSTFTINGEFNVDDKGNVIDQKEKVSFTTSVDADKITGVISDMIKDYNELVDHVNKLVNTKPERGSGPLTDEQKKGLSADEIKTLESKAKDGILYGDSLLRGLSDKLRTVFSGVTDIGTLKNMGISVGSAYSDNGKITFDEEKFKAALQEDPEKMKDIFTRPATADDKGGISNRLKAITDQFAKTVGTPKGSLIEKAGSTHSPASLTKNSMQKISDQIDKDIAKLKVKLQKEIDRYSRQFSSLEQLVSQMNSQSSWFAQGM